jgi:predicted ribosomally synthesized peptide with SipW-like signal peptide
MKKLLFSFLVLGITSVLAIGATTAYFSDSEVLSQNTISSGTLEIEALGDTIVPITVDNIKPGDILLYSSRNYLFRILVAFL